MLIASLVVVLIGCVSSLFLRKATGRNSGWVLALFLFGAAGLLLRAAFTAPGAGTPGMEAIYQSVPWMPSLGVSFAFRLDGLALVFSLLVLLIGAAVLIYSTRYLGKSDPGSFYLLMSIFAAAMLLLVLTDDLVVLFVAWEITTLCSYLLIARSGPQGRDPAIRTLLVTVAGGLSLLTAVAMLIAKTGTTQISVILSDLSWTEDSVFTGFIAVLIAGAVFTKSAQFPFQSWLPDSMVAIAPVSAYLHAAAMVKAGIYLALRFSPALHDVAVWQILLITCGLVTALLGAFTAVRRNDLKELLAYSTMSQLGLLVTLVGVGTPAALTAAVVHTIAHALFKAALFMTVGIVEHEAGTRDRRELAHLNMKMPFTAGAAALAALSMAGVPLTLGFISKESLITSLVDAPFAVPLVVVVTAGVVLTSMMTFAYSARYVLALLPGRPGKKIAEASSAFFLAPVVLAVLGLIFGLLPALLNTLVGRAAGSTIGEATAAHLAIWHGVNLPLALSALIIASGVVLVLQRERVDQALSRFHSPVSGLAAVESIRSAVFGIGKWIGVAAGSASLRRHLAIPIVCMIAIAGVGIIGLDGLPDRIDNHTNAMDWVLVGLIAAGVLGAMTTRNRISVVVVLGVTGYAVALWFFSLGASDVAMTQLLVETLTLCVLILVVRRLPLKFPADSRRSKVFSAVIAVGAGLATFLGVWSLTGRRELSDAANWYLNNAAPESGGENIVNTILVDFRALDTLGELTVLGVAGLSVAALLQARAPSPMVKVPSGGKNPLDDPWANAVFFRAIARVMLPIVVLISIVLLFRGHYEPGGGFIGALVGGAGFALLYLAADNNEPRSLRLPYLVLIGGGILVGAATGFTGYLEASYLKPVHFEVIGVHMTTSMIFDVGVYLAVVGVILASFNLLGKSSSPNDDPPLEPAAPTTQPEVMS